MAAKLVTTRINKDLIIQSLVEQLQSERTHEHQTSDHCSNGTSIHVRIN